MTDRMPLIRKWTDEEDALIRDMVAARKSAIAIGARLHRKAGSVQTRARRLGLNVETQSARRRRLGLSAGG